MAPIDFEKELQKRWRSQETKPREQVWTRLSARLEQEGPESGRRPKLWLFMAAASVVLLIGFFLFRGPVENLPASTPVVRTPEAELPTGITPAPEQHALSDSRETAAGSRADDPADDIHDRPSGQNGDRVARAGMPKVPEQGETGLLAKTHEKGSEEEANDTAALLPQDAIAEAATKPGGALEAEVEALLNNARESIGLQNEPASFSPANARALLDRAEDELDQTFREKIMEKLKSEVTRPRTSVAGRDK